MTGGIRDETLMALADDALSEDEAARLRAVIAASPEIAERYARFVETRYLLEGVRHADSASPPVRPDEQIRPSARLARSEAAPAGRHRAAMALAASIALMIGLAGGALLNQFTPAPGSPESFEASSAPEARAAIARALSDAPSGAVVPYGENGSGSSGRIAMMSSHRTSNGVVCRQYEVGSSRFDIRSETLLSCRGDDGVWRKRVVVFGDANDSFATASGSGDVAPLIETLGGGSLLTSAEEAALLRR